MKILLAADGSQFTKESIALLTRMAFPEGSELTLLTVIPGAGSGAGNDESEEDVAASGSSLRAAARRMLDGAAEQAAALGLPVRQLVRTGHVANEIIDCAAETGSDLIVMGTHGMRGIERFLLGSAANKVVTYAACSVLVVRAATAPREAALDDPLRVLIAVDGSSQSRAALEQIATLSARRWCSVHVVTVLELVTAYHMDIRQRMTASWQNQKAEARRLVEVDQQLLSPVAASVTGEVIEAGSPSAVIVDKAAEMATDMIVLGGTGRGRIERALLGSTSSRVVRHASCSVWVARRR